MFSCISWNIFYFYYIVYPLQILKFIVQLPFGRCAHPPDVLYFPVVFVFFILFCYLSISVSLSLFCLQILTGLCIFLFLCLLFLLLHFYIHSLTFCQYFSLAPYSCCVECELCRPLCLLVVFLLVCLNGEWNCKQNIWIHSNQVYGNIFFFYFITLRQKGWYAS